MKGANMSINENVDNIKRNVYRAQEEAFELGKNQAYREVLAFVRRISTGPFIRSADIQVELLKALGEDPEEIECDF